MKVDIDNLRNWLYRREPNGRIMSQGLIFLGGVRIRACRCLQTTLPLLLSEARVSNLRIKYRKYTADELIIKEILTKQSYPFERFVLKNGSIIIDVGAHIGCFTLILAKMVKDVKVFSFEPQSDNYRILKRNVRLNKLGNVCVFKKGLSKDGKGRKLYLSPSNTGAHSISVIASNKYSIIDCIALEDVLFNNGITKVDLLKLDCEGAEYEILYSTSREYLDRIDRIIIEYHDFEDTGNRIDELIEFLSKKGFKSEIVKRYSQISGLAYFYR